MRISCGWIVVFQREVDIVPLVAIIVFDFERRAAFLVLALVLDVVGRVSNCLLPVAHLLSWNGSALILLVARLDLDVGLALGRNRSHNVKLAGLIRLSL